VYLTAIVQNTPGVDEKCVVSTLQAFETLNSFHDSIILANARLLFQG